MIGAGGSGCEFGKSLALQGIGCIGKILILDDDYIEMSNLNRQHMFRHEDVGKPKAEMLAIRMKEMRPWMKNVEGRCQRFDFSTVGTINWEKVDLIFSAVDSISGR